MNKTIQILAEICEKYRFEEKLLFVPSYSIGHQIGESLARTGASWINLRTETAAGYAHELVSLDLGREKIRFIDANERLVIIEKLYRSDDTLKNGDRYFEEAAEIPGILKCLSNTIHEIKMAGLDHDSLDPEAFIAYEKGKALSRLLFFYNRFLQDNRLVDHAGLIARGIEKLNKGAAPKTNVKVLVLSDFPMTHLEKALIALAGGKDLVVVDHERPLGLDCPKRFFDCSTPERKPEAEPYADIDLLKRLFKPEKTPAPLTDDTVTMFHALGESNEVREVFRKILKDDIRLDDVEILVTSVDPYMSIIYEMSAAFDISATFAGGVPITYTRPGRALILYLKWQAEDFQAAQLKRLFSGNYLDLNKLEWEGEKPSSAGAARVVREANIGWGRDRCGERFEALQETYLDRADEKQRQGEEEKAIRAKQAAEKVAWVGRFVKEVMATIPRADVEGNIATEALYTGAFKFVKRFCRVASELDGKAKARLLDRLAALQNIPSLPSLPEEAAERLIKIIVGISVSRSNPRPGHIHVAHYRSGGYSQRPHTFVIGLDQNRFPGVLLQDPVILDAERRQLGGRMTTASRLLDENVYIMTKVLSALQGKVVLSYSCRELTEDREVFPSSLLLRIYRLVSGDHSGDYRSLAHFLGKPVGFIPHPDAAPLNEWEWWMAPKSSPFGIGSVLASYPHLLHGKKAEAGREGGMMSEYDGWIPSAKDAMDPLHKDVVLSCSRLESLAKCPFAFFIKHVLGIEPLEEMERDVSRWLEPLQRGLLLHQVFYRFMKDLKEKNERPDFKKHLTLLEAIAFEEIADWKREVPPAGELAYKREIEDIKLALEIFLKDEHERCKHVEPCFFELSFGIGDEEASEISAKDPVEIKMKTKGSFKLRGRVDRIDRCKDNEYEVWDYKTGSTWGYKDSGYVDQGRQLQHALYAIATEIMLRKNLDKKAKVVRAGYFFPSTKGDGRRIERDQRQRAPLYNVLEDLFQLLQQGVFPAIDDKNVCGNFCDYEDICGGKETATARSKRKLSTDVKMDPLRRLKDHA